MKKLLLIAVVLLLALMSIVPAFAQSTTEVRIAWWGSQNRHDRTIAAIELYEELNPGIDIVFEFSGWDDHWTKMSTQAAGENLPDIMQQDYARIEEWVNNGLLMPLDDFIESGLIDTTNIAESSLVGGMVNGEMYGINLGNNSETFALDIDAFEAAGVELPPMDWTWTDFERIATELHDALGIYGHGGGLNTEQLWKSTYMSCCDQWSYNAEGTALGYEDDQPLIDFLNMQLRLQEAGVIPSIDEEIAMRGSSVEEKFVVPGEAAMDYFWSNQIVAVWTAAGEDRRFAMYPVPRVEGGQSQNYIKPSMFFSITSQAKQPEEAAKFISWFNNSIEANEILFAERGVPVSSVVREALLPMLEAPGQTMFEYLAYIETDNSPIRPADPAGHADIINNIWLPEVIEPVLYGLISPEEAAQILREEADAILAQNIE